MSKELQKEAKNTLSAQPSLTPAQSGLLQRTCACGGTPGIDGDCEECRSKRLSRHQITTNWAGSTAMPSTVHKALSSPGQSVDAGARTFTEAGFGHDFSKVQVHATMPGVIQTKLTVNQPGDKYEQEADRVAEQVMRMPVGDSSQPEMLNRQSEEEEEEIQRQPEEEEEEEILQAKESPGQTPNVTLGLQSRINSFRGGGQPLPESTRAFMEPRFGFDFSQVRIHADQGAAQTARAVHAQAYTVGQDLVFREGQYAPETQAGKRLLAHELTHAVQQSTGPLAGTSFNNMASISDPANTMELAANETSERVMSGSFPAGQGQQGARANLVPQQQDGPMFIQRYAAGEAGHQSFEEISLVKAGFGAKEAKKAYFGNWLRDFSQLPRDPNNKVLSWAVMQLLNILALGEFGHELTPDDLGTYLPSEHLDNPAGGGTYEDPLLEEAARTSKDKEKREKARRAREEELRKMSPAQKTAYEDEQKNIEKIQSAATKSGLPEYIERGKYRAIRSLKEAISLGHTDKGMRAMTDGLHIVEDYFSHSNFTEVAILSLYRDHLLPYREYKRLVTTSLGSNAALLGEEEALEKGLPTRIQPRIITGSYGEGNTPVSLLEILSFEVQHGELAKTFVKGAAIKLGITAVDIVKKATEWGGELGRKVMSAVGGITGGAIGAVGGSIAGGVRGAARGAAEGWREHPGWTAPWHAIKGIFTGAASGVVEGAQEGWSAGKSVGQAGGGAVGQGIGSSIGGLAGLGAVLTLDAAISIVGVPAIMILFPPIFSLWLASLAAVKLHIVKLIQRAKTKEAALKAGEEGWGPTHAELTKDSTEHLLYPASKALAIYAGENIAKEIRTIWETGGAGESSHASPEESITILVNRYISQPSYHDWWKKILLPEVKRAAAKE